jgi:hypothetical protein
MGTCEICDHPKIEMITKALATGRSPNLVRHQYNLDPLTWAAHLQHLAHQHAQDKDSMNEPLPTQPLRVGLHRAPTQDVRARIAREALLSEALPQVTENPLSQFKQAWQLAKDDDRMRADMVNWLNDQLRHDDMGL